MFYNESLELLFASDASAPSRFDPAPLLCGVASIVKRFAYCPVNLRSVNLIKQRFPAIWLIFRGLGNLPGDIPVCGDPAKSQLLQQLSLHSGHVSGTIEQASMLNS